MRQWEWEVKDRLEASEDLRHYSYYDETLPCAPNRRRGDFWYLLPTHSVVLEVDEHFHGRSEVSCEVGRIWELKEQNPLPMYLIRYNPHWPFRPDKLDVLLSRVRYALVNPEVASSAFGGVFIEYLGYPSTRIDALEHVFARSQEFCSNTSPLCGGDKKPVYTPHKKLMSQ